MTDKPRHKRLAEFESFDRIELTVVPRYKTSELSGDEWRQHVAIKFYFKGEVVYEAGANNVRSALMLLGGAWIKAQAPIPDRVIEIERTKCDQPSCPEDAVGRFLLKRETDDRGEYLDPKEIHGRKYRQFCERHLKRGDCSREDADDNYEPLDGFGPSQSTNLIESPSQVLVINAEEFLKP